jgi:type IV secretory pathway TrbD component
MNTNLLGVIVATAMALILSDIWIPVLFGVVLELIAHRARLMKVTL